MHENAYCPYFMTGTFLLAPDLSRKPGKFYGTKKSLILPLTSSSPGLMLA